MHVFLSGYEGCLLCGTADPQARCTKAVSNLLDLQIMSHAVSVSKGWWETDRNDGEMIALMHSELSEALEALRHPGPSEHIPEFTALEEEMADVLIRVADFCQARGLRLEQALAAKIRFNHHREFRHGGKKF